MRFCDKAHVLINHRPSESPEKAIGIVRDFPAASFSLHETEFFSNLNTCNALASACRERFPSHDLFLHIDTDEFIAWPEKLPEICRRIRAGVSDYAQGKMIDRMAPGCNLIRDELPSLADYRNAAPVQTRLNAAFGPPELKCYLTRRDVLIHDARQGWKRDKEGMLLEHYRWTDSAFKKTDVKMGQHKKPVSDNARWRDWHVSSKSDTFWKKAKGGFRPKARELHGWMDYEDLYRDIAEKIPEGGVFVELGVWCGRSLGFISEYVALLGKSVKLIGYDQFDPKYYLNVPAPIAAAGISTHDGWCEWVNGIMRRNAPTVDVSVIRCDSSQAASLHSDGTVFACFVDAGHTHERVLSDINAWYPKVAAGGILAGHDIDHPRHPGVRTALEASGLAWKKVSKSSWVIER